MMQLAAAQCPFFDVKLVLRKTEKIQNLNKFCSNPFNVYEKQIPPQTHFSEHLGKDTSVVHTLICSYEQLLIHGYLKRLSSTARFLEKVYYML